MDEDHFWERDKYPKCFDDDLYKLFRSGKSKCPSRPKKIYNNKSTLKNDIVEAVNSRQKKLRFDTTFAGKDTLKVIDSYIRFAGIMTGAAMDWNIIKDKDYIVEIRYKN